MEKESVEGVTRSRRVKEDKLGRLAALQKLKSLKGTKHKYEVVEEAPVYEEVSEKEYSRLVQERQEDNWIVDDNGAGGYADDGREIFDDDVEDDIYTDKKSKQLPKKKSFAGPEKRNGSKSSDIKNMFKSIPVKRKMEQDIKLEDDDILGSIMEDLHKEAVPEVYTPKPMVLRKKHKLSYHSPRARYEPSNFDDRHKSPLASDFVPKIPTLKTSPASTLPRKPLQPKVVDFDYVDNEQNDLKEEIIEEFSQNPDFKPKVEEVLIDETFEEDINFDPSADIFCDTENQSSQKENESAVNDFQEKSSKILSSFQGSLKTNYDK
ncbi:DNA polymerase alpha catalytic subunit, partial [Stegodyphus mimosarum]